LIIILEAGPIYTLFMAGIRNETITSFQWLWLIGSFLLVLLLCILAVVIPMRMGIANLRENF